ncbi:MAG: hypothetical protein H0W84_06180, partial [Bacteroidetes bacterium]|nr:hypothetical protein [Bacteroidota bacterium]
DRVAVRVQKPVGALDYYRYRIGVNAANSKVIGQKPWSELDYYRYRSGINSFPTFATVVFLLLLHYGSNYGN